MYKVMHNLPYAGRYMLYTSTYILESTAARAEETTDWWHAQQLMRHAAASGLHDMHVDTSC